MNDEFKRTFDNIHAPKALIADTKRLVAEERAKDTTNNKTRGIVYSMISMAVAAVCIGALVMTLSKGTLQNKDSLDTQISISMEQQFTKLDDDKTAADDEETGKKNNLIYYCIGAVVILAVGGVVYKITTKNK